MPELKYRRVALPRCRQGDVFRDVVVLEDTEAEEAPQVAGAEEAGAFAERHIPYCVLLSQDCDLEHDYNNRSNESAKNHDKYLPSLLLSPAYPAEQFKAGEHLKAFELKMTVQTTGQWEKIKGNQLYRYHYLPGRLDFQVPELVVDFKHFFTVPRETFYRRFKPNYLASIDELFREDFSNRFAYYLSRIGLPEPV